MKKLLSRIQGFFKDKEIAPKQVLLWLLAMAVLIGAGVGVSSIHAGSGRAFPVYISEVMASNTSYPNDQGRCCDFIEIHNGADYPVDLSGFQLGDIAGKSRYAFPADTVIQAGQYLAIYCDKTADDGAYAQFEVSRAGGEEFFLIAKNGAMVDSVTTLAMDADQSMVRHADDSWSISQSVTPGKANDTVDAAYQDIYNSGVSPVRISEFSSAETGYARAYSVACDWVELYNTAAQPVDISGFTLSDNVGNDKYVFPQGAVIEAGAYYVVYCTDKVTAPDVAPFGLSQKDEETVVLKNREGLIVEIIRSVPVTSGSMALGTDGTWAVTQMATAGFENTQQGYEQYLQQTGARPGSIRISEVMAAEQLVIADSFDQFSDWVELHNTTQEAIDLAGWYLSDDPTDPQRWVIPELVLQPGERTVIFCSGRGINVSGELHAEFSLSAGGESLTLTAWGGAVVDAVNFPASTDHMAFVFGDDGQAVQTDLPTPGYGNDAAGYEAFCAAAVPQGPLAIWEVMTSNDRYLPQMLGQCYDWVELRNISDEPLDLSGYSISDDPDVPNMHCLRERTLQPGETVTIILSGEENMARNGYEHAMFSLNAQEDQLLLYDAEGKLLDYVYLKDIPLDYSYGRSEDEGGFCYMEPSPQNPNTAGWRLISSAVEASYAPGVYSQEEAFALTLSAEGTIYYTTDGSVPDTTSEQYETPLQLEETTVVRAVAVEPGKVASDVYTATFIVGDSHTLPVVSLVTDPEGLWGWGGVYRNGDISVKEIQLPANVAYSGSDGSFSIDCATNLHGATTVTAFDKKTFAVRFQDSYDGALHYDVFEDGEVTTFSSLILRTAHESTYSTQMHDILVAHMASQTSDKVLCQKYKYVALYLNGEYWGLYAIRERHSQEHYASYMDVPAETVQIVRYMTDENNTLQDLYHFCSSYSLKDPQNYAYVKTVLDVESFADWMIYEAYVCNLDIYGNIRYYMSPEDGLWRMGLADLDLGMMGSTAAFEEVYHTFHHSYLVQSLVANEEFQDLLASRLAELLAGPLSDENMINTIHEIADSIRSEAAWEEERWGTPVSGWESAVNYMVRFCDGRAQQMINSLCGQLGLTKQEREYYFGDLE